MAKTVYALIVLGAIVCSRGGFADKIENSIHPIPEVQQYIEAIADSINSKDPAASRRESYRHAQEVAKVLGSDTAKFRIEILRQCVYYLAHREEAGNCSTNDRFAVSTIYQAYKYTLAEIFSAELPYLETKDDVLLDCLYSFLEGTDLDSNARDINFAQYVECLKTMLKQKGSPSLGLMKYMYQRHPGHAVLDMTEIDDVFCKVRRLLTVSVPQRASLFEQPPKKRSELRFQPEWDKKALSEELARLSKDPKWWVRLWVVEVLKQLPELEGQAILVRLKSDPNEYVRDRITKPDPVPREYRVPKENQASKQE